ncbi:extracellular solute-binding protein, partial [Paenibacillus sp.]|uniref:extracellular solute-binding protein n=1 Tax=Paenibacillus sp. TaxID=58172 RepID=UPI002D6A4D58
LEPIEYTFGAGDNKVVWGGPINKIMQEKTGVSLKYDIIVGDIFQKWDLWLASGDYPDIVRLDAEAVSKYRDAGAIIPLNDLIDQYGPNIKAKWGDNLDLLRHSDGNIYSIYSVNLAEEAPADSTAQFVVQYAVLEEAGFPEIKTLDQLYTVIKDYVAKHPDIDGNPTIGFGAAADSWTMNIFFNNASVYAAGHPDHGNFVIDENNQVKWNITSANAIEYYKFLNKLYNEGLLDKEAFTLTDQGLQAKMAQGRVLAAYAPSWFVGGPQGSLRAEGKLDRQYAHLPIHLSENVVDRSNALTPANGGTHEWAITEKAKNPERIIQFIDFLFSDEGQILTQWGIEGVHYDVVDGKRQERQDWIDKKTADPDAPYKEGLKGEGTGGPTHWFSVGNGAVLADGDLATPITPESVRKNYDDKTKEVLGKMGIQTWADLLPPVQKVPGYLWQLQPPTDDEFKRIEQQLDDLRRKAIPGIVMAKDAADFDAQVAAFLDEAAKIGLDKYEAAYNTLWNDYISK